MAVTKIIPIRVTLEKSVSYICNPEKTHDGLYVHSEHCTPQTAALTFSYHLRQARAGGNTIGRHLIQSFAPGEVSPEDAHEIGKQLAAEILGGQYAYVMATHVDRGHIHNHFVWGAVNVQTHTKYRSNKNTYHAIRDASDRLCEQHNLSVIVPQGIGKSYTEYQAGREGTSWKAKLRQDMDTVLSESTDYDDFLRRMESLGYEIKKGKYISFRAPDQQRLVRAKTLGAEYTEESLRSRLSKTPPVKTAALQSIIDIESNEKIKSSPDYRQWAAVFNLKQSAAAFNLIQQYGGIAAFDEIYKQALHEKLSLSQEANAVDADMKMLSTLRNQLRAYGRTKDVYRQYQNEKSERKKEKIFKENEGDIIIHRAARKALAQMPQPIPSTKTISAKMDSLKNTREEILQRVRQSEAPLKEMEIIRKNLYKVIRQNRAHEQKQEYDFER